MIRKKSQTFIHMVWYRFGFVLVGACLKYLLWYYYYYSLNDIPLTNNCSSAIFEWCYHFMWLDKVKCLLYVCWKYRWVNKTFDKQEAVNKFCFWVNGKRRSICFFFSLSSLILFSIMRMQRKINGVMCLTFPRSQSI